MTTTILFLLSINGVISRHIKITAIDTIISIISLCFLNKCFFTWPLNYLFGFWLKKIFLVLIFSIVRLLMNIIRLAGIVIEVVMVFAEFWETFLVCFFAVDLSASLRVIAGPRLFRVSSAFQSVWRISVIIFEFVIVL